MLLRLAMFALGAAYALAPRRFVDFWMDLATDDPVELRPWVYAVARLEGIVFVLWALRRTVHDRRATPADD